MSNLSADLRFGILGGGFGMYGWLPAVAQFSGQRIATLSRYESVVHNRPELSRYREIIDFVDRKEDLIRSCDALVCAKRPQDQVALVRSCSNMNWRGHFVLEKPLAPDPKLARGLIALIESAESGLTLGFTLGMTDWAAIISMQVRQALVDHLQFRWRFEAHHFQHNIETWKRHHQQGGGSLRFYAIHFLAILSILGDWDVTSVSPSEDLGERLHVLLKKGNITVQLECDCRAKGDPQFELSSSIGGRQVFHTIGSDPFVSDRDPIIQRKHTDEDGRVAFLIALLKKASTRSETIDPLALPHLDLWERLERFSTKA